MLCMVHCTASVRVRNVGEGGRGPIIIEGYVHKFRICSHSCGVYYWRNCAVLCLSSCRCPVDSYSVFSHGSGGSCDVLSSGQPDYTVKVCLLFTWMHMYVCTVCACVSCMCAFCVCVLCACVLCMCVCVLCYN